MISSHIMPSGLDLPDHTGTTRTTRQCIERRSQVTEFYAYLDRCRSLTI